MSSQNLPANQFEYAQISERQNMQPEIFSDKCVMDYNLSKYQQYPPILDWLQYTRYRPPRLPSKGLF